MKSKINITLKKHAKQSRSLATVGAIVEAATYILRDHGPGGFTTNKVAERAGVNIASFYQYFPNKESLLFHIAQTTWESQFDKLSAILAEKGVGHAAKFKRLIREFFLIEAAEADLRQALRFASIDLRNTAEFEKLMSSGALLMTKFLRDALGGKDGDDLKFKVRFIGLLVTSFAERTTDEGTARPTLIRQADLLSDIVITQFGIAN